MRTQTPTSHHTSIVHCLPSFPRANIWRLFGVVHHLRLLLREALSYPLAPSHELLHAAVDAAGLAGDEGLGGEVVDAGVEAAVDEAGEHLWVVC